MTKKNKCFAYLRVSTEKQINGYGLDIQNEMIEKYCRTNNFEILKIYSEQVSGTKGEDERPVFKQMISDCKKEDIKTIIIDRIDRFARWWSICEKLYLDLAVKNIDVVLANTGENITQSIKESPIRKFIIHVLGGVAELEYSQTCDRLKKGREKSVKKNGEFRRPKFGHCGKDCKTGAGHSPRCLYETPILKRILYDRKMKLGKRKTFKQIAIDLNAEGIPTRDGKEWNAILVFNAQKQN